MDKVAAIEKVRLLHRLAASASENEASNAFDMAKRLIEKYELLLEDYEEKVEKPVYTNDDILYKSKEVIDWKRIIALAATAKFDCFIIQEEQTASTGDKSFAYFIYGEPDDVAIARHLFNFVCEEIEKLLTKNCTNRGQLYIDSYSEGIANSVKINIEYENYHVEGLVKPIITEEVKELENTKALAKTEATPKEKLFQEKIPVSNKEKPLDLSAYFAGEKDGMNIHIGKIEHDFVLTEDILDLNGEFSASSFELLKNLFLKE